MAIRVAFWFDVEDFISPRADDALFSLLNIFEERHLQATWKLVGEKLRALERRGRTDIIGLIDSQDFGYHTDYHSVHPTVSEYCNNLGWEEGQLAFELREGAGLADLTRVFGRLPSTYGQPGGSWAPHVYPVLNRWGIPTYVDETSHIGLGNTPFHYCGITNVLNLGPNTVRTYSWSDEAVSEALACFDQAYENLSRDNDSDGLIQVYYHPCEYSSDVFWDYENFRFGMDTPRDKWRIPTQISDEEMKRRLGLFTKLLDGITSRGAELVTTMQIADLYKDRAHEALLTVDDLRTIFSALSTSILMPVDLVSYQLSPAESLIVAMEYLATGAIPKVRKVLGPTIRTITKYANSPISKEAIATACQEAMRSVDKTGQIPSSIQVGSMSFSPQDFAATIAPLCTSKLDNSGLPQVQPHSAVLGLEKNITGDGAWGWIVFPPEFDAPSVIETGKLQAWTLKPAVCISKAVKK